MIIAGVGVFIAGLFIIVRHRQLAEGRARRKTIGGVWAAGRASPSEAEFRVWILMAGVFAIGGVAMVAAALLNGRY